MYELFILMVYVWYPTSGSFRPGPQTKGENQIYKLGRDIETFQPEHVACPNLYI